MGFPSFLHFRGEPRHWPHKKSNKVVTFAGLLNQQLSVRATGSVGHPKANVLRNNRSIYFTCCVVVAVKCV
jgi:hypothetical protein